MQPLESRPGDKWEAPLTTLCQKVSEPPSLGDMASEGQVQPQLS